MTRRPLLIETALVLGVSLGASAIWSVLRIVDLLTRPGSIAAQTTFAEVLFAHAPGETVPVTVVRNGLEQTLQATLAERPRE